MTYSLGYASTGNDWLWQALGSKLSVVCMLIAVGCVVAGWLALRAMSRMGRRRQATVSAGDETANHKPPLARLAGDQSGLAMIEFVLCFPILLFMALLLTQTMMLMAGNLYVHYAAFAATRAAIVQTPQSYASSGETRNVIIAGEGGEKHEAIRKAAVLALVPAAGLLEGGVSGDYAGGLNEHFSAYGRGAPKWVETQAAARVGYADAYTKIVISQVIVDELHETMEFVDLPEGSPFEFGPKDPISVQVRHDLNLGVPYVGGLFSDGKHSVSAGPGRFTHVRARYTLTNEGVDHNLPPLPELPRVGDD